MIRQGIEINLESVKCHFSTTSEYYKVYNMYNSKNNASTTTSNHIPPSLLSTYLQGTKGTKINQSKEVTNLIINIISNLNKESNEYPLERNSSVMNLFAKWSSLSLMPIFELKIHSFFPDVQFSKTNIINYKLNFIQRYKFSICFYWNYLALIK